MTRTVGSDGEIEVYNLLCATGRSNASCLHEVSRIADRASPNRGLAEDPHRALMLAAHEKLGAGSARKMGEAENNAVREFSYRWSRFVADFPCQLQIEGESQVEQARCVDISEGGMAIRTVANLQLGTQVLVNIQFPGSSGSITLRARVVGARHLEYGLCFVVSSDDEKETVRLFLSSLKLETFPQHRLP